MRKSIVAALFLSAVLAACGGSDEPIAEDGRALIDPPNCAASGACR